MSGERARHDDEDVRELPADGEPEPPLPAISVDDGLDRDPDRSDEPDERAGVPDAFADLGEEEGDPDIPG